ncbi:MAG TPA: C40 family peptidase, partial [Gemmatimonadaceae bacterium]|nr:C40 family peptidase [Gemmatimonadaceae bacterium]
MKSLAVAPHHPALVAVAAALVAALPLAAPRPLAAQVAARIAGTAWRPGLDVPLSVLVKIGTAAATGRGVLGTVLRLPRRAPSGGTSSGSTTKRSKTPASTSSRSSGAATAVRVLGTADHYVGTPYVFGGTTPEGFDCSGFVQYVYRKHGVSLPRTAAQQGGAGQKVHVALRDLRPGDLML